MQPRCMSQTRGGLPTVPAFVTFRLGVQDRCLIGIRKPYYESDASISRGNTTAKIRRDSAVLDKRFVVAVKMDFIANRTDILVGFD